MRNTWRRESERVGWKKISTAPKGHISIHCTKQGGSRLTPDWRGRLQDRVEPHLGWAMGPLVQKISRQNRRNSLFTSCPYPLTADTASNKKQWVQEPYQKKSVLLGAGDALEIWWTPTQERVFQLLKKKKKTNHLRLQKLETECWKGKIQYLEK